MYETYTPEQRREIVNLGIQLGLRKLNNESINVKEYSQELAIELDLRFGALYDRIGNTIHIVTNGRWGRHRDNGPSWVISETEKQLEEIGLRNVEIEIPQTPEKTTTHTCGYTDDKDEMIGIYHDVGEVLTQMKNNELSLVEGLELLTGFYNI